MKISTKDINSLIKNPSKNVFAYLLHGLDAGLIDERTQQLALLYTNDLDDPFSVSRLTGKEVQADAALLSDALNAVPLSGTLRIVMLSGTATELAPAIKSNIDNLNSDCRLIITAKESTNKHSLVTMCEKHPKIASIACYPDENKQIQNLVSETLIKHQINISTDLVKYISEKLGNDRSINKNEIEKLALYGATTNKISKKEIDSLLGDNTSHLLDKMLNNVFTGNTEELGILLSRIKLEGIQPIVIIRFFQAYIKVLMLVNASIETGLSIEAAINDIRPPIYFKKKQSVINHTKIFSIKRCSYLLEKFTQLEKKYKTGSSPDPYSLIGQSLLGIAISLSHQRV